MKNQPEKITLTLEDLQLESFVTSIDSEVAMRLSGGLGNVSEPTHTEQTDDHHTPPVRCTTVIC
ncbi:pinensin family lanthipeptide [Pedobacter sp. CFBP9032]|uniref:pinensin family lanthipeptide n=1 Tax=Pedobacter sp. CFBP9032 TaxID=3096539 RepID=UPI002A6A8E71|nr:pinensin family lanthipeptide [Pedobacter sp. CFBP9032]MDY0904927.1 pinensin family lanthipeptide [Pedobacter sp. CFBP9032]